MVEFLKPVTLLRLAVATSFSCCVVVLYWTTAFIGISGRNSDDSLSFGVPHVYSENSLSERAQSRYGNATLALHQAQASNAMSARAGVNGVKATHATAPTVTGRSQNACLVTSYGTDGIGHQLEAKLSCIAVAAASRGQLSYAHRPMDAAQHGANASKAEDFFGVGHAVPKLPYAVAYNAGTMMTRERSPLPFMGVCHETSWFDGGIRGPACKKAASGSEGMRVVFQADNCFDEFYCSVTSKDQGGAAATWRKKVLPVLRGALFRTIDNRTLVSSQHPGILLVSAHARRGDGKTRGASGAHLQSIIRGLGRAWNGRVNVTIHTDGHTKELLEEIGTIGTSNEDGRINVHALGSGDGVSLEAACLDIIRADVFLASDSSLSRACGLYRDQDPSTVIHPSSAFLPPHLLARFGWTVAKTEDRGKGVKTERYDVAAGGFVDVTDDFWAGIVGRNTAVQIGQKGTWKLRVDWSSLSPVSALAREITSAMAHCDSSKGARTFQHLGGGVGMNLHTWALGLCAAMDGGKIILTQNPWQWMDKRICANEEHPMLCYFGDHLPEANCEGADSWSDAAKTSLDHFETCPRYMNERRSVGDFMGAAMEYLFQSVRPEVIAEAERQAREAFPEGLPDPNNMVTVHMRWGDKPGEVGEKTPAEYFVAGVKRFVQMKGLGGSSPVHIYLASEDEVAIRAFGEKAPRNWRIHTSGPTGKGWIFQMMSGSNGLASLGALLLSMQANNYVLVTTSNWSRLIDELRTNVVDPRCSNCTQMIDLHPGQWPHQHKDGKITFDSFFGTSVDPASGADFH